MTFIEYHHQHNISPDYISGFSDGEGCFSVTLSHHKRMCYGLCIIPNFVISQNIESISVLQEIQSYFGCGTLRKDKDVYRYKIRKLSDLQTRIRPHFEMYPLHTQKAQDFKIFCELCDLIADHQTRNLKGLLKIVAKDYTMNA